MENVLDLISDSRLLAAKQAYDKLVENPDQCMAEAESMRENEKKITTMTQRCAQVDHAMALVASENPNWTLATDYLGVKTHYMLGDDGLLWVRMESTQCDIPVVEQLAVVYEVEWFKLWIPFCNDSRLIARLSKFLFLFVPAMYNIFPQVTPSLSHTLVSALPSAYVARASCMPSVWTAYTKTGHWWCWASQSSLTRAWRFLHARGSSTREPPSSSAPW
jgi:hypothetical protein